MDTGEWTLSLINAVAVAVFLNSGIAKTVASGPSRRAVEEVLPVLGGAVIGPAVRVAAAAEIVVAAALPIPALRVPAAVVAALLGVSFVVLGLLGAARHSEVPCGCFGSSGNRPLGWVNVLLGVAVALVLPANAAWPTGERYPEDVLLVASILSITLCMYMRRELVVQLLVPNRNVSAESEAH